MRSQSLDLVPWLSSFVLCLLIAGPLCGAPQAQPNVVLFIADDVSWNDYGCYGNKFARTPNIDALAEHGIRFDNAYLTASSCSPSRSSIITGRYPHNNGRASELHLPIASNLAWFPEILRQQGYYTAISGKHHMKVDTVLGDQANRPPAFDLVDAGRVPGNRGGHANWVKVLRERPVDRPFFCWFAAYDAHRGWDADADWDEPRYGPKHAPEQVVVPPFLVDDQQTREDLASYYNEVTRFDFYIGQVVEELRRQQQLDNTLILVLADNGRPFPRAKTRLHDSGMKTALVAHWPAGISDNGVSSSLVSVLDIAPTIVAMAGAPVPRSFQGVSMLPLFENGSASIRKYCFSEHNWHDYEAHGRSIRDGQFLYIRNSRPYQPWQGPADSVRSPSHASLLRQRKAHALTTAQADVFLSPRPAEELYVVSQDPQSMHNVATDAQYARDLQRLRELMDQWASETADSVPDKLSADSFHRETGVQIDKSQAFRGTSPGIENRSWTINAPGPR